VCGLSACRPCPETSTTNWRSREPYWIELCTWRRIRNGHLCSLSNPVLWVNNLSWNKRINSLIDCICCFTRSHVGLSRSLNYGGFEKFLPQSHWLSCHWSGRKDFCHLYYKYSIKLSICMRVCERVTEFVYLLPINSAPLRSATRVGMIPEVH